MPHLNEEVCCVKRRCDLIENLPTFREKAVPIKGQELLAQKRSVIFHTTFIFSTVTV